MQVLQKNIYNHINSQTFLGKAKDVDPIIEKLRNIEWDFPDAKPSVLSNIHPYPAKFISEIPMGLIECLWEGQGDFILDPFCGSGSTLEAAQRMAIPSVGVDLNPIACLISRVRTAACDDSLLVVCEEIADACKSSLLPSNIPTLPNIDHWFMPPIQRALSLLKNEIEKYSDSIYYDSLRFCLSSIIVKVSNQDSDTRYAFRDKNRSIRNGILWII